MASSLKVAFGTSKTKEEEGVWLYINDDIAVKIRRFKSRAAKDASKEFEKAYRLPKGKSLTQAQTEELVTNIMAKAIIVDWKGVTDTVDGEEVALECTFENKLSILNDDEMEDFRTFVANAANERDMFQLEVDNDAKGN